jgi:hypothetical protein
MPVPLPLLLGGGGALLLVLQRAAAALPVVCLFRATTVDAAADVGDFPD